MTPAELKSARHALGLTAERFAVAVGVSDARTVRRWEAGDRAISQAVAILLQLAREVPEARAWLLKRASKG